MQEIESTMARVVYFVTMYMSLNWMNPDQNMWAKYLMRAAWGIQMRSGESGYRGLV
jgi:hypothetical protein